MDQAKNAQRSVGQHGKDLGQARPLGVVVVFIPPAIFDEVQAVLHMPMVANVGLQCGGRDATGVETGREIAAIVRKNLSQGRAYFAIDTKDDLTIRKVQTVADILGVVQVEPQPPGFAISPLFSVT